MTARYILLPWIAGIIAAGACLALTGCTSRAECRRLCEDAGLVVSRSNGSECDCADPRAPAYIDNSTHTTTHVQPVVVPR